MDDHSDSEFEVETIVGKKIVYGEVKYNIKWKGFPKTSNTWEPVENLDCPKIIAKYEKKNAKKSVVWDPTPTKILNRDIIDGRVSFHFD